MATAAARSYASEASRRLSDPIKRIVLWGISYMPPLRDNMDDLRPKSAVQRLLKVRRRVETAIGQLVEFFDFAVCKAHDLWHLFSYQPFPPEHPPDGIVRNRIAEGIDLRRRPRGTSWDFRL